MEGKKERRKEEKKKRRKEEKKKRRKVEKKISSLGTVLILFTHLD